LKAIIVAAGQGNRLRPMANNKPKCLVRINGKSILERQLEVLQDCGIENIVIVRGYKRHMFNSPGIKYYTNPNYKYNNILESLFYAKNAMNGGFVFSYSDIIYSKEVLEKLLADKSDIGIVMDTNWRVRYKGRKEHPITEAELVKVKDGKVLNIGKGIRPSNGEFIGLAKFSKTGAETLRVCYETAVLQYRDKEFQRALSVRQAYLTDMLQEMADSGYVINTVDIKGGWMEIDTIEDFRRACELYR